MAYTAPVEDMKFVLHQLCDLETVLALPGLDEADADMIDAILDEAAKYAGQVLSPLNYTGDKEGLGFADGQVTTPNGWKPAYETLVEMGWNAPAANPDHGGMGLPQVVNTCIQEMFQGANMSFQLCPMLTQGAIEALELYGSEPLQEAYLPKLVTGEWTGTMNLTEPQAGSDLAAIRSKAVPEGDHYRVSGQKIFITYGEHDMVENIIHLVLARLPDAPEGVKGISLFVVPKFLLNADGSLGDRNDVRCVSIEHKLGIHASPTCTLSFGDDGGAVGYLVGEANRGLEYMFAMMNNARLNVGLQGIGVSEHAVQDAARYAAERKQGKAPGHEGSAPILAHPDIRRMLGLMRARTEAARIIAYRAAAALDIAARGDEEAKTRAQARVDLLIPVVKGWSTENSVEVASLGVQVHGGMGFVEETGAAQHLRDARITTIYEGTTGIQALDLVGRKLIRDRGVALRDLTADIRASEAALRDDLGQGIDWAAQRTMLADAATTLETVTDWLLERAHNNMEEAQAAATNILDVFGLCIGAWVTADAAAAAATKLNAGDTSSMLKAKLKIADVYRAQVFPQAAAAKEKITTGSAAILALDEDLFCGAL